MSGRGLHELAEQRSIELHRAVAERLRQDPSLLEVARARVRSWTSDGGAHPYYAEAWQKVLDRSLPEILAFLTDPGELARSLRQASPFAGYLDPKTRFRIHREVLERWSRE